MFFATLYGENTDSALPLPNLLDLLTVKNVFSLRLLQFSNQWHKKQLPTIFDNHFPVTPVMFIHIMLDMLQKLTSIKHVPGLILEKQRSQSITGKNVLKISKIKVFPTSLEKLNSTYYRNKYKVLATSKIPLIYLFQQ